MIAFYHSYIEILCGKNVKRETERKKEREKYAE